MSAYIRSDRDYRRNDRERLRLKGKIVRGEGNGATAAALVRRNKAAAEYREKTGRRMGWSI